jgi:hypothetical protein
MTRRRLRTIAASLLLLVTTIALAGWFTLPASIPARGDFHGFALDTTVDSESARYYVESYAQGSADDPQLHDAIDTLKRDFGDRIPNHVDLRLVAQARSVDFAALFFAAQLLSLGQNAAINDLFRVHVDRALREEVTIERSDDITVVLVPGYDYEENGRAAGADLQEQVAILRTLGFRVAFVDVDPIGTVMESAAVISRALEELAPTQVVIAGPSSAGPAIQTALSRLDPASGVLAWLNLGGTLQGVPLLDWFQAYPQRLALDVVVWAQDWRHDSFESLTNRVLRDRFAQLSIPADILVFNYISMSLSGDISRFGWDKQLLLRADGANDGLSLLPDLLFPQGVTIVSPKGDHFFAEDPLIAQKTVALVLTVLEHIDSSHRSTSPPPQPLEEK